MKHRLMILSLLFATALSLAGQEVVVPKKWDLKTGIEYAIKKNIQVQKARITTQKSEINLKQSKEALFPSVSANSSFSYSNGKIQTDGVEAKNNASLGSNYSINAGMTLFNGLKNFNTIKQNELLKHPKPRLLLVKTFYQPVALQKPISVKYSPNTAVTFILS